MNATLATIKDILQTIPELEPVILIGSQAKQNTFSNQKR